MSICRQIVALTSRLERVTLDTQRKTPIEPSLAALVTNCTFLHSNERKQTECIQRIKEYGENNHTCCVMFALDTDEQSAGQMSESFDMPVLLTGTTISVMAMDRHCRIRNDTTMPKNPIIPKATRCGSSVPTNHE